MCRPPAASSSSRRSPWSAEGWLTKRSNAALATSPSNRLRLTESVNREYASLVVKATTLSASISMS